MRAGKAEVTISSIVEDLPQINYEMVIFEAITNAIQANANQIIINIKSDSLEYEETDKYIDQIIVEDNGEGFTDENIKAFKEYKTKHKRELGCKGIGRFLYLKVFEEIDVKSLGNIIEFRIDKDIKPQKDTNNIHGSEIIFKKPKFKIIYNREKLHKGIEEHFLAYFKLLLDEGKNIEIIIKENGNRVECISNEDIPSFDTKEFNIKTHKFVMHYIYEPDEYISDGYYCAGKRVVKKNSELETNKKLKLYDKVKFVYILESEYLNNNINETRDDFTIYPKRTFDDLMHNLSWEEIQEALKNEIYGIFKEKGIDINEIAMTNLKKAVEEKPFLGAYLKNNNEIIDSEALISNAYKKLEEDKKYLRKDENRNKEEFLTKLSLVTQTELAEYMYDRHNLIQKLKDLIDKQELEEKIHDIFMKRKTKDEKENFRSNNLWLFDDRFMTYDKVFSDKQIKEIMPELADKLDRPDLLSIVSNTYEKKDITDIVIIELKRPDTKITPAGAEEQLLKYSRYIQQSNFPNDVRIWTYAFLSFDSDTAEYLEDKDYNKIPTHNKFPIFYKFHDKRNTIMNFMDLKSLAYDAERRHKTFMKILSGETI